MIHFVVLTLSGGRPRSRCPRAVGCKIKDAVFDDTWPNQDEYGMMQKQVTIRNIENDVQKIRDLGDASFDPIRGGHVRGTIIPRFICVPMIHIHDPRAKYRQRFRPYEIRHDRIDGEDGSVILERSDGNEPAPRHPSYKAKKCQLYRDGDRSQEPSIALKARVDRSQEAKVEGDIEMKGREKEERQKRKASVVLQGGNQHQGREERENVSEDPRVENQLKEASANFVTSSFFQEVGETRADAENAGNERDDDGDGGQAQEAQVKSIGVRGYVKLQT